MKDYRMYKNINFLMILFLLTGCEVKRLTNIVEFNKSEINYITIFNSQISYTKYIENEEEIYNLYDDLNVKYKLVKINYDSIKSNSMYYINLFNEDNELIIGIIYNDGYIYLSTSFISSDIYCSIKKVNLFI